MNRDEPGPQAELPREEGVEPARRTSQTIHADGGSTIIEPTQVYVEGDYYEAPETLWASVKAFVGKQWPLLTLTLVVDAVLLGLCPILSSYYLVLPLLGIAAAVAATLTIPLWFGWRRGWWSGKWVLPAAIGLSLLLAGILAWEVKQVAWPKKLDAQRFGIAVARFGEGSEARDTKLARNVTELIYRGLEDAIRVDPTWSGVGLQRVGLVKGPGADKRQGSRVRADLVIWGQIVQVRNGRVFIRFRILENPDRASSPRFPVVLPAISQFTHDGQASANTDLEEEAVMELALQQSQCITAFTLGLAAYFERNYPVAADQFLQAATELDPKRAECTDLDDKKGLVYFYLGRSYQRQGKLATGEEWLLKAQTCAPAEPAIPLSIAYGYNSRGEEEETQRWAQQAIDLADRLPESDPQYTVAAYDRALGYLLLRQPLRGAETFDAILARDPSFYIARLSAGNAYLEAGEVGEAIVRFQAAIQQAESHGSDSSWGYLFVGDAYREAGDGAQARAAYRRAVELAPTVGWMRFRLAEFYRAQGEIDLAWAEYEETVKWSADQAWANAVLGDFLRELGRYDRAIECFDRAIEFNPDDAALLVSLGKVYLERFEVANGPESDAELAEEAFMDALAKLPPDAPFRFYGLAPLGRLYYYWHKFGLAAEYFSKALEFDPDSPEIWFGLARAYDEQSDAEHACAAYFGFLRFSSGQDEAAIAYAQARIEELCAR